MTPTEPPTEYAPLLSGLRLVMPGRRAPIGAGVSWVWRSWRLFAQAPLMWILAILIFFVFSIALSLVPILGSIVVQILTPVYTAGFAIACRSLEMGGDFELDHLLAGFKSRFKELAVVGVIFLVGMLLLLLVFLLFAGVAVFSALMAGSYEDMGASLLSSGLPILLGLLVALALFVPLLAAYWFAPYLVLMHGVGPVAAMKASFGACVRNFLAFFVYGLVLLAIAILALLPSIVPILGWIFTTLAFLVLLVMNFTGVYPAYRDIFTEEVAPAAPQVVV
jgi:hypothetical protein